MNPTKRHLVALTLTALSCTPVSTAQTVAPAGFAISADTPVVEVGKRSPGRSFVRLPALSYQIDLDATCPADFIARTISLSSADTRKSLSQGDIAGSSSTSVTLTIPAAQISPVAVDGFCLATEVEETVYIPAVLSVQASLLCANDEISQIVYASSSLDVTLLCKATGDESPAAQ